MYYIIYGNDKNRIHQRITTLQKKYHIESVTTIDATQEPQSAVLNEMDSVSLFDDQKMIVVDHADFLSSKDTTHYEVQPFLERQDSSDAVIVVFCCASEKLDKRKKAVKSLLPLSTVYECKALDGRSQPIYVRDVIKEYGLHVDQDAMNWIVHRIGMDPMRIRSEIEKLSIYSSTIHLEDAQALITPEPLDDIFKMVDALFQRNALLVLAFYRNFRRLNMEPVTIVSRLAGQIRFLFQVRVCMDEGMDHDAITEELHAHPYRVQINMENAQRFSADELLDELASLADLDRKMKQGLVDKDAGFEQFVMEMLV
ncbi:DNA polymerase III subunit delta [Catenisphaera adipataccumulans]|jgi:DNA polymerase-3 subunit delta|uniref:DNA polymerase III subunit delta n=1 Tax=Catenisphaera adipataccumulans TaxID=700500 RepID=A0A7W8FWE7_9FIRM|nr:DNA polymerase III subunit delta [Catenisphaera adipataccumulans]MBB5183176.1 DNA polymerase-3 subunit delta [Catenisphaera adipataccumulans]